MNKLPSQNEMLNDDMLAARKRTARAMLQTLLDEFDPKKVPELEFPSRSLGFEIEVEHDSCMDRETFEWILMELVKKVGGTSRVRKDPEFKDWCITKDQTFSAPPDFMGHRAEEEGIELVSPILRTHEDKQQYVQIMHGLAHLGFYASAHCGSHVWFGVPEFSKTLEFSRSEATDFVEAIALSTGSLKEAMLPYYRKSRQQTLFSGLPKAGRNYGFLTMGSSTMLADKGKEAMINMQYLTLRGAMEYRSMGNTMDPAEICKGMWVIEHLIQEAAKPYKMNAEKEFVIRDVHGVRGPIPLAEARSAWMFSRWNDHSMSIAEYIECERPEFRSSSNMEIQDEVKMGLRSRCPVSEFSLRQHADKVFADHVFWPERPASVERATQMLDDADQNVLQSFRNTTSPGYANS